MTLACLLLCTGDYTLQLLMCIRMLLTHVNDKWNINVIINIGNYIKFQYPLVLPSTAITFGITLCKCLIYFMHASGVRELQTLQTHSSIPRYLLACRLFTGIVLGSPSSSPQDYGWEILLRFSTNKYREI